MSSLFLLLCSLSVASAGAGDSSGASDNTTNPFTPRASLIRYWNSRISNNVPKPSFLMSKASPLTAVDAAAFSKLAAGNALSDHLPSFCAAAGLLCFPDPSPSLEKHDKDSNFAVYSNQNFTNYGNDRLGGVDSFKNYSDNENVPLDSFRRYSRGDRFNIYGPDGNVVDQSCNGYGVGATGGTGEFKNYNERTPNCVGWSANGDSAAECYCLCSVHFIDLFEQSQLGLSM